MNVLNVYYQNCRGLNTKTTELHKNISEADYDIVMAVETWLGEGVADGEIIDLDAYSILRSDRNFEFTQKTRGGGVFIACRKRYKVLKVAKNCTDFEALVVQIRIKGMLSHQLKQFKIDGEKTIIQNPNDAQKKEHEKFELDKHEVYAMDVLISTGEGVGKETDTRVSIYKKTDETYQLKLKASRMFYTEVRTKYGNMPFNLRSFQDETKAKMGVVECVKNKLIEPFQVLHEKSGEFVAHFKFTVLLMPNGPHKITGLPFDPELCHSEYSVTSLELKSILNSSANPKAAKKKKKKSESSSDPQPMEVEAAA